MTGTSLFLCYTVWWESVFQLPFTYLPKIIKCVFLLQNIHNPQKYGKLNGCASNHSEAWLSLSVQFYLHDTILLDSKTICNT